MKKRNAGFSLIEMLLVTAIIAILASMALPNYNMFRRNAYNSSVANDARNIAPAAELVASDGGLADLVILDGTGGPVTDLPGATTSPGVVGTVNVGPTSYTIELEHPQGNLHYQLDSDAGWAVSGG